MMNVRRILCEKRKFIVQFTQGLLNLDLYILFLRVTLEIKIYIRKFNDEQSLNI